jgi:tetratricopeptide (TPR) repeat protein
VRDWLPLAGLPPVARWTMLGVGALLVALLGTVAVWTILQHRDAAARQGFAAASVAYRQAMAATGETAPLAEADQALKQFLKDHGRSAGAAQAWYFLGNVEYRRGAHDAAIAAFAEAARRDSGSIGVLSRLGAAYAWEAKNDPARALGAYQEALQGRGPKDFLYGELLLGVARAQEQLTQTPAAIETYRRLLKDVPDSPRAEEVRARLAILGAAAA